MVKSDIVPEGFRHALKIAAVILLSTALSACIGSNRFMGGRPVEPAPAVQVEQTAPADKTIAATDLPTPNGETVPADQGQAPVIAASSPGTFRVALLLPLSATGNTGGVALSLKNAAEMAMAEYSGVSIDLVVKDDRGTADGAREATRQALSEGASALIGPLLSSSVQVAGSMARAAQKPVIAFSTDAGVAGRGVYLLSFIPRGDVERILDYAASKGKKTIAALLPDTAYGSAVNAALQDGAARRGLRLVAIERYADGSMDAAAKRIATVQGQIDALLIPENGDGAAAAAKALVQAGIDTRKVQLLGTGAWDDPRVFQIPAFQNGWFPLPEQTGFQAFANRYRTKYGSDPARIATLAYDAVFLANALHAKFGDQAFDDSHMTAPEGVIGLDGLFRFRADGTAQRGLAVMQVGQSGATRVEGAPSGFQ